MIVFISVKTNRSTNIQWS